MKKAIVAVLLFVGLFFLGAGFTKADTATQPTPVKSTSVLNVPDIISVVTIDDPTVSLANPTVIKMTNYAYRHPEQTMISLTVSAPGTYELRVRCRQTRLPHTWVVYANNVRLASSILKCE